LTTKLYNTHENDSVRLSYGCNLCVKYTMKTKSWTIENEEILDL